MVVGFIDTFNSDLCVDYFDNNFVEKRICWWNFVVNNWSISNVDDKDKFNNYFTNNNYWRGEYNNWENRFKIGIIGND